MPPVQRPFTGGRLAQLAVDLTTRERQMLRELATLHLATTGQLSRLVFGEYKPASARRLGQRHTQRLVRFGLMHRFVNRSRDRKVGPPGFILKLTDAGLSLSGVDATPSRRQRSSWQPNDAYLAHRLAISELYVRLAEQARVGGPTVREFRSEPDSWRHYTGYAGESLVIKADALVRLIADGQELSWFVEIDRGTEGPSHITAKCRAYQAYELADVEQQRHGVFPGVLFVVPSSARARSIQRVIDHQPAETQGLFKVATDADAPTVLGTTIG